MYLIASSFGITPADYEESCLQDRVDTSAQTDLLTKLDTVDGVEVDVVLCNVALHLTGQVLLQALPYPKGSSAGSFRRQPLPEPYHTYERKKDCDRPRSRPG